MTDRLPNENCPTCGADHGPSTSFPWHLSGEDCRAVRDPNPRCQECGGEIQATVPLYLTMGPGGFWSMAHDLHGLELHVYCENDHEVELSNPQRRDLDGYLDGLEVRLGAIEEPDDGRDSLDDGPTAPGRPDATRNQLIIEARSLIESAGAESGDELTDARDNLTAWLGDEEPDDGPPAEARPPLQLEAVEIPRLMPDIDEVGTLDMFSGEAGR